MSDRVLEMAEAIYAIGSRWDCQAYGKPVGQLAVSGKTRAAYEATWGDKSKECIRVVATSFDGALAALHAEIARQVAATDAQDALEVGAA